MSHKKKTYIFSIVFGIICILGIIFAISMTFIGIKNDSDALLQEKKNLKSFSEGIKDLQESRKFYDAHKADFEKIDRQFVDPAVPVDFIKFLEKTAVDSNLLIKISPASEEVTDESAWPSLSFQITTDSSFPNLLKFLEKIENSDYLIETVSFGLTRVAGASEGVLVGDVNASFSIKAFVK